MKDAMLVIGLQLSLLSLYLICSIVKKKKKNIIKSGSYCIKLK